MPVNALLVVISVFVFSGMALAAEDNEPDAELLEFLADWDSGDDQWIEPFSLEQANTAGIRRDDDDVQATQERDDEH